MANTHLQMGQPMGQKSDHAGMILLEPWRDDRRDITHWLVVDLPTPLKYCESMVSIWSIYGYYIVNDGYYMVIILLMMVIIWLLYG